MTDNNTTLRTTTIGLDEYNRLHDVHREQSEIIGAKTETIKNLEKEIIKLNEKQPLIKVIHFTKEWEREYDDYNDEMGEHEYLQQKKVEFVNLTDVTNMAVNQVKASLKNSQEGLENELQNSKYAIKELRDTVDTVQERLEVKEKQIKKLKTQQTEELDTLGESYEKNLEGLKKAYKTDEKDYKETISDLKEEVKKVKENKTDVEIEEKRNKEIKDLKLRIKDLEKMVEDLGKLNFFSRIFKLRSISAEVLATRKELIERQDAANRVGTTYVKENGKYRSYNAFNEYISSLSAKAHNYVYKVINYGW